MKKIVLILVLSILLLSVTACGGGTPSVKIVNNTTTFTACHFYIAAAGSGNWGDDLLAGAQIAPGESKSVDLTDAGTYDMKISDCEGANEVTRNGQDVKGPVEWSLEQASGASTSTVANNTSGGGTPSVKIINNTATITVCHFYIATSGSGNWGDDLLAGVQIAPGASKSVDLTGSGTYDMKVSDCEGANEVTRNGQDVNGPVEWSLQQASGPSTLNITNDTKNFTFCFLYISTDTTNWGDDLLQGAQIKPGETRPVNIANQGIFNLKLEDCNHANPVVQQKQDFSVPASTVNWTVSENNTSSDGKTILRVQNNNATTTLCYLYIAPSNGSWGDDVLRGTQIAPGSSFDFSLQPGKYKAKAIDCAQTGQVENDDLDLTHNTIWNIK